MYSGVVRKTISARWERRRVGLETKCRQMVGILFIQSWQSLITVYGGKRCGRMCISPVILWKTPNGGKER